MLKRTRKITFRVTDAEYERIKKKAVRTKLKMEPFIRACLTNEKIYEAPPIDWGKAVRQLSAIGNNVNQITQVANISKSVSEESVAEVKKLLANAWKCVRYYG